MKKKTKISRITISNRWAYIIKPGDWTIIGINKWCASWDNYKYSLCLFGLELNIWFEISN